MAALLATQDRIQLVFEVVRRVKHVANKHREVTGRDMAVTHAVEAWIKTTKTVRARWIEGSRKADYVFDYTEQEYEAISSLAIWLVDTFHKLNGTDGPNVAIWGICFEAHGARTLADTGLLG